MPKQQTNNDYRVLKTTTCLSLSGRSEIKAAYSYHEPSKNIMFQLVENSGSGHFSTVYIKLDDILKCLETAKEPFSLSVFKELYPKQTSRNNFGFLGSLLKHEGLIVCDKRRYLRSRATKPFVAELDKLIKPPAKETSGKRPAKK